MAATVAGCASLTDRNESIIQVETSRDAAKAKRLTLAGVKAMNTGHIDYAFDRFMEAVAVDETYGPAHNNLGLLHYDQGELYDAVLSFERASELMPTDPIVFYNLGLALEAAGRVHEAMDLYWQAVEMDPTNPNFLGNLVRLRVRLGENSPEVVAQLQDLVLIETRPEWRRWADRQLALGMNPMLDRGPEAPDFDMGRDRESNGRPASVKRVIDLTPTLEDQSGLNAPRSPLPAPSDRRRAVPAPPLPGPIGSEQSSPSIQRDELPVDETLPEPMQDSGSFETLPPTIEESLSP
jgi:hypothetical protein